MDKNNTENDVKQELVVARLVLIGETGVGKSKLSNFFVKEKGVFEVGDGVESLTLVPASYSVNRGSVLLTVVDTPGFNDTEDRDRELLEKIIAYLKVTTNIVSLAFVYNYKKPRKTSKDKELLENIVQIFKPEVLKKRLIVIFTNAEPRDEWDEEELEKMNLQTRQIDIMLKEKIGNDFNPKFYFVNTKYNKKYNEMFQPTIDEIVANIKQVKKTYGSMSLENITLEGVKILNEKEIEREENERKEKERLENERKENEKLENEKQENERREKERREYEQMRRKIEILNQIKRIRTEIDSTKRDIEDLKRYILQQQEKESSGKTKKVAGWILFPLLPISIPLLVSGYKAINQAQDQIASYNTDIYNKEQKQKELEEQLNRLE